MIQWIKNHPNETLQSYASRLIKKYQIEKEDILVGLSFGGLIVQQIAEILGCTFVILISSFRTKEDLKILLHKGLQLKLHRLMPEINTPFISELVANYLNSGSQLSKPVLQSMIASTDMQLMKWSIEKIYEQDTPLGQNIIRYNVIGDRDRIVKLWKNEFTHVINNGSHFMVYDQANQITSAIQKILVQQS